MERFRPQPWTPDLPFDWATGGRQLSEEELKIAKRLPTEKPILATAVVRNQKLAESA